MARTRIRNNEDEVSRTLDKLESQLSKIERQHHDHQATLLVFNNGYEMFTKMGYGDFQLESAKKNMAQHEKVLNAIRSFQLDVENVMIRWRLADEKSFIELKKNADQLYEQCHSMNLPEIMTNFRQQTANVTPQNTAHPSTTVRLSPAMQRAFLHPPQTNSTSNSAPALTPVLEPNRRNTL